MGVINWFFPKEEKFFDLLKAQADVAHKTVEIFNGLVMDYKRLSAQQRAKIIKQLEDKEHEGDKLVQKIVHEINNTFITPIDREDIHTLAILLDDIVDFLEGIGRMFVEYNLESTDSHIKELTRIIHKGVIEIDSTIAKLSKLQDVRKHCNVLHDLETQADEIKRTAISSLFKGNHDPLEVIKYKDIYSELETVTDKNFKIATIIEGIVVKHA